MTRVALPLAFVAAFGLAACTPQQETDALAAIDALCIGLPEAASLVVSVGSSITGAQTVVSYANLINTVATKACSDFTAGVANVIASITAAGGTATVDASTTSPATAAALRHLAGAMRARGAHVSIVRAGAKTILHFTIPPNQLPF